MGTVFTKVYNRFLGKITDDMYMELTPADTVRDLRYLLIDAIPLFEFPRKNLNDYAIEQCEIYKNDVTSEDFAIGENTEDDNLVIIEKSFFFEELTTEEINILAILMMIGWVQRQLTSIENTRMKYSGTDFKMTSQANHLAKLQSLLNECQRQAHHYQRLYKRREIDRDDGSYRSTWYLFGNNK